ncbi:MAG TPA: lasso peptide biosynthesis B2 protein [Gemmatimonadales bacterium]|jgi:hypothetical protein
MKRLRQLIHLTAPERGLLLEAVAALSVSGLLLRMLRFSRVASRLGRHMAEGPPLEDRATTSTALRIRWAVETASRHLPWKPVCLPQAVAAQWMLRRRGIASTLYLGVNPAASFDAHAWVRAGTVIVTGGPREDGFAVVSSFA